MQDEYGFGKFDCVDGSVGPADIAVDHFQDAGTGKASQHLGGCMLLSVLGKARAWPKNLLMEGGKATRSFLLLPIQKSLLSGASGM